MEAEAALTSVRAHLAGKGIGAPAPSPPPAAEPAAKKPRTPKAEKPRFKIPTFRKPPAQMSALDIRRYDADLSEVDNQISSAFIAEGRGHETRADVDRSTATDPLTVAAQQVSRLRAELRTEAVLRGGARMMPALLTKIHKPRENADGTPKY
jgi:hypothetical protein